MLKYGDLIATREGVCRFCNQKAEIKAFYLPEGQSISLLPGLEYPPLQFDKDCEVRFICCQSPDCQRIDLRIVAIEEQS